ncbi:Cgl0159 family (beta/alpha)8-fold protein [Microcella sp.]|uniref:Cgl0159 family (beta/alpha)8-fold protein n=1 Tax=Microcella sp. TaxID=1913979 RepID=UPI002569D80A|nr:deoxyribose-phosphate aldolase [Microcella sp.]MBX9471692.1 deoxyribose-phosphate aldolase [Microcella sp.]
MTNDVFEAVRHARAFDPDAIRRALLERTRRPLLVGDNRLFILAADHPARGSLGVREDEMAMADRYNLLGRLAEALQNPRVDGFLGTADLVEDLALMGVLENKIVVGSTNRGGLKSAVFEMDDRFTAYNIDTIRDLRLDFAKLLVRINLDDAGSVHTLDAAAEIVARAVEARLPIMIEPFMSEWIDGSIKNDLSTDAVIKSVAIASALGASSAYTWLKLPVVPDMERVMKATTLPTLLLGGDPALAPHEIYESWEQSLSLPGVHGLVVGRTLLYPEDGDVVGAVERAARLVHGAR